MNTQIYFVRHAHYKNPQSLVPGRIPGYNLDELGIVKARKLGEYFQKIKPSLIYTSPLERAFETADIIAAFIPEVKLDHVYELTEVDAAQWQAYKLEDLFTNHYYEEYINKPNSSEIAENLNSLSDRIVKFTNKICIENKGQSVVCVSHKDPITVLRLSLEKKPLTLLNHYRVDMASISHFTFDDRNRFISFEYKTID